MRLKKTWITTAILRSMHNKDKLHKKYLNQKIFLIDAVLHEIFKRNRILIKKLLRTPLLQPLLHPGPIWHETKMKKKIMQITNVNKRLTNFPRMIKHEKHTDNFWGLWWIPSRFSKKFKDKVFTSHEKVHENVLIQNGKPQRDEKGYLWSTITRIFPVVSIQKQSPGGVLQKNCP